MVEIELNKKSLSLLLSLVALLGVVYLAYYSRSGSLKSPTLLDYDPHWHGRHAEMILENDLQPPDWDLLSFYPPGRAFPYQLGWEYTLLFFHFILKTLFSFTFFQSLMWANILVAGMTALLGYFFGKWLTNEWGGVAVALFLVLSPAYMGVSQAGYIDSDGIIVFFITAVVFSLLYAFKKRSKVSIAVASAVLLLWTFYWQAAWFIIVIFLGFLPGYLGFLTVKKTFFEDREEEKFKLQVPFEEVTPLAVTLALVVGLVTVFNLFTPTITLWESLAESLGFVAKQLIVNVSVAELQPIGNIFSLGGLKTVRGRIGYSFYLSFLILPLVVYKLFAREELRSSTVFCASWLLVAFYMLTWGWRFALLFAIPAGICAGLVVGELFTYAEKVPKIYLSVLVGALLVLGFFTVRLGVTFGLQGGYDISANWLHALDFLSNSTESHSTNQSLVMTWWDPGHILAHETGLKVHADGAHCNDYWCYPWGHNQRIQDMGRMMSTENETEAYELIKKYQYLTEAQKAEVLERFGDRVPEEAFEPVDKVYFISSSDLLYKFVWMNYFGGYSRDEAEFLDSGLIKPGQCQAGTTGDWVWCPWVMSLTEQKENYLLYDFSGLKFLIMEKEGQYYPVYHNQYLVDYLTVVERDEEGKPTFSASTFNDYNATGLPHLDGLFWLSEDLGTLVYLPGEIKESVFAKTFLFNGAGLRNFHLIFWNEEVKIFLVELK